MKKDDKEREREIKKARENTVKSIDKIMDPKRKIGGCFLATHVAKFSDSTIPADVAWYCDEPKQPDMPYLSYLSVRTDDIDGIYGTAANMSAVKLLCTASGRAWCADDNEQPRHTCRKTMISQRRYSAQDLSLMRQSAARFFPYPNARRLIKHQTGSARCTFLSGMASTICFLCFLHL